MHVDNVHVSSVLEPAYHGYKTRRTVSTGRSIFECIQAHGVGHVFCVPGESFLSVMDAFHGSTAPQLIATRHEEGAGLMAEAYAKATGNIGVCMVTRGPGLTHLSIALHTAFQDSTPLVALVGQVPTSVRYRDAFQEMDVTSYARTTAKWAVEIGRADRVPELMHKAFHVAASGRAGPVVVALPEDVDCDSMMRAPRVTRAFPAAPSPEGIEAAASLLRNAARPCIVAGGGVTRAAATADLVALAESINGAVYTGWRRFDAFPNDHRLYLGPLPITPPDLTAPLTEADVVLVIGTRLDQVTTGSYSWPSPGQKLIHIDISAEDVGGGVDGADVAITSDARLAIRALCGALRNVEALNSSERLRAAREAYLRWSKPRAAASPDGLTMGSVYHDIMRVLPDTASISSDAGTFARWLMRYYRWNHPRTFFAPTAGGMGYAVPGAIGAKLARPQEPVVAIAGDGGFAMTMCEIETAVRLKLRGFVMLVFNNSNYGTIRSHQQRRFPGRSVATDLGSIDFAKTAESMGARGFTVRTNAEFTSAFVAALSANRPSVVDIVYDADAFDPRTEE
jgi:acetolactate synthase-1/2/3 large subunit